MTWLYTFVDVLFNALILAILIRVIISWLDVNPYNPLVSFIYQITDPIIVPLRRVIPPFGMIDVTPMIAWILLAAIKSGVLALLARMLR